MKRNQKIALGLCAFYLVSVIGLALTMHFCGGKLAAVAINANKTACKYCKTEVVDKKDDGCCKNTKVELKVKDSHQVATSLTLPKLFSANFFFEIFSPYSFVKLFSTALNKVENKAPPAPKDIAIYLLNCVFRN